MTSGYLQPADYDAYGITGATDVQVSAASRKVDGYLGRPEGLMWMTDAAGNPSWMAANTPTRSLKLASPIAPGTAVQATIGYATFGQGDIGSAVVLDRADTDAAETCVIAGVAGNILTLDTVLFAHDANATAEFGLTIAEDAMVVYGGMAHTSALPVARLLSVFGSYRSGRRDRRSRWLDELLTIGTVPTLQEWNDFPLSQCDFDSARGVCWFLPGTVRSGFSRARLSYIAGWSYDSLPEAIKLATAAIVQSAIDSSGTPGNWKVLKDGDGMIERFSAGSFDVDTMSLLAPYRNVRL